MYSDFHIFLQKRKNWKTYTFINFVVSLKVFELQRRTIPHFYLPFPVPKTKLGSKNVHHPKVFQKWKLLASTLAKSCFAGKETFLSGISYIISGEYDPLFKAAFEEYFGNVCPEGGPKENDQRVSKTKEFAFLCLFLCIKV